MFGEHFAFLNELDFKLSKLDDSLLNQLYLRVFNTDDGQLILRDLQNRCFVNSASESEIDEGARRVYLSIQTRMKNAITNKKQEE